MDVSNLTADADRFTCNVYLVEGDTTVLVDAGTVPSIPEAIRSRADSLDVLVLTHQHGDHVEQLDRIHEAFQPTVLAYGDHPLRDRALTDGDRIRVGDESFEVVHTPGHAADHIALVGQDTLFSGDVVVYSDGAYTGGSFGRTDHPGQSRDRLIESLRRLLVRLPETVEWIYPGHGESYAGDVRDVLETALERAERHEPKYPEE